MLHTVYRCRDWAFLIWLAVGASALAQELGPPPAPTPFSLRPGLEPAPAPARVAPLPGPFVPPPPVPPPPLPPPSCLALQDCNGTLLAGDPLLDRPDYPPPGWFTALDVSFIKPHIKNRLTGEVFVDGFDPTLVHVPTASLAWTVSPRFEVGYRLPQGFGEVLLAYRFVTSTSTATRDGNRRDGIDAWGQSWPYMPIDVVNPDGALKSRLDVNSIDLDYSSREYTLNDHWDMKWRVGVRLATVFFDAQAAGPFLEQRTSNHFIGAGPHVGLDLWRCLRVPGLSLFGSIEGSTLLGRIRQTFEETVLEAPDFALGGATLDYGSQLVPVLRLQTGLGWTPHWEGHWLRLAVGYEFERWWFVGRLEDSSADLTLNGLFFRAEYRY